MRTYVCLYCFQTTTSAIVDRFTKGLKGNEYFRVKVSLEKSTIIKKTAGENRCLHGITATLVGGLRGSLTRGIKFSTRKMLSNQQLGRCMFSLRCEIVDVSLPCDRLRVVIELDRMLIFPLYLRDEAEGTV